MNESVARRGAGSCSQESVSAFFDTGAYLRENPIISIRAKLVDELLGGLGSACVLDLGCGDASVSLPLLARGNRLTLVDRSGTMLEHARGLTPEGAPVDFVQADIFTYAPGHLYDAVLCVGVLAHVTSVEAAIARVSSALRPQGLAIIQITDEGQWLGRFLNRYSHLRRRWSSRANDISLPELASLARGHELEIIGIRRYGLELPGSGHLPFRVRAGLEGVAARRGFSRLAGEVLALFEKEGLCAPV
jgi:SAM-dependent methyltransferase